MSPRSGSDATPAAKTKRARVDRDRSSIRPVMGPAVSQRHAESHRYLPLPAYPETRRSKYARLFAVVHGSAAPRLERARPARYARDARERGAGDRGSGL